MSDLSNRLPPQFTKADDLALTYFTLHSDGPFTGPKPRAVLEPICDQDPEHMDALQVVFSAMAIIVVVVAMWVML